MLEKGRGLLMLLAELLITKKKKTDFKKEKWFKIDSNHCRISSFIAITFKQYITNEG